MKFFVRTTGDRKLDNSYNQIDYELLIDEKHNNKLAFAEQVNYLATLNVDVVILEDDLYLCKGFKSKIQKVINEQSNDIINFFYEPKRYFSESYCDSFIWNQCVYYPKHIVKLLSDNSKMFTLNFTRHHDRIEGLIFRMNDIKFQVYRPCLVQHLNFNTLIHDKVYESRTIYFIDYLEELHISYENALKEKDRLMAYHKQWFEKYEKSLNQK